MQSSLAHDCTMTTAYVCVHRDLEVGDCHMPIEITDGTAQTYKPVLAFCWVNLDLEKKKMGSSEPLDPLPRIRA